MDSRRDGPRTGQGRFLGKTGAPTLGRSDASAPKATPTGETGATRYINPSPDFFVRYSEAGSAALAELLLVGRYSPRRVLDAECDGGEAITFALRQPLGKRSKGKSSQHDDLPWSSQGQP